MREFGAVVAGLGVVSLVLAYVIATDTENASKDREPVAGGFAGAGLGMVTLGTVFYFVAPTVARQEGATTQWAPPSGPVVGAAVGARF